MVTVNLPEIVAGRDMADEIVDKLGPLDGQRVTLDAGNLVNGSASFAAQIVERVLVDGGATELVVTGSPARFSDYLARAAQKSGADGRITLPDSETAQA